MKPLTETALHDMIQPAADSAVRRLAETTGRTLVWDVDTTTAGTVWALIWEPDGDAMTSPLWTLEQGDDGLWSVTAFPSETVLATAASPVVALRCVGHGG